MTDKQFVKNYVPFRELKREGFFQKILSQMTTKELLIDS